MSHSTERDPEVQDPEVNMFRTPQILVLVAAFVSFLLSVSLWFTGSKEAGQFVSVWVPSVLCIGIYVQLLTERGRKEGR